MIRKSYTVLIIARIREKPGFILDIMLLPKDSRMVRDRLNEKIENTNFHVSSKYLEAISRVYFALQI